MAPRRMKDRRPPSDVKEEPISETASSPLGGDDLALRKKRGRPRKSAHASAFADREGDDYFEDADFDEDAAASDEDDSYQEEQKGMMMMPTTIAKEGGVSVNGGVEQKRESTRKGARRTPIQQSGKDGLDLQSELLMRCLQGRGSHRRKGKPTRAVQASF